MHLVRSRLVSSCRLDGSMSPLARTLEPDAIHAIHWAISQCYVTTKKDCCTGRLFYYTYAAGDTDAAEL
jgi:hypothetical protein